MKGRGQLPTPPLKHHYTHTPEKSTPRGKETRPRPSNSPSPIQPTPDVAVEEQEEKRSRQQIPSRGLTPAAQPLYAHARPLMRAHALCRSWVRPGAVLPRHLGGGQTVGGGEAPVAGQETPLWHLSDWMITENVPGT